LTNCSPKAVSKMPKSHPARARLDPRQPLVLDTRVLGRRPGSMRHVQSAEPVPADLGGQGIALVPAGSEVVLDLRLESVMEGVLVSGTVDATMTGECGRCLDPVRLPLSVDIQELFRYPESGAYSGNSRSSSANGTADDDDDLPSLVDDLIDLEPVLRDALVLELPMSPLCRDDCPGLCPGCGEQLARLPDNHSHDAVDPRWAALAGLRMQAGLAESSPEQES
jgi:uncharacterized protein